MKYIIAFLLCLITASSGFCEERKHPEKYYQSLWCAEQKGISEVIMSDNSRLDCLTETYAVEFDFADKWAEAIGQSLLYGANTGKQSAIALIMEDPVKDLKYLSRLITTIIHHKLQIKLFIIQ